MTNSTPLSSAAQAVLTAATQKLYCLDPADVTTSASEHGCAIAAALRTISNDWRMNTEMIEGVEYIRTTTLEAIAAELEGQS